MHDDLGAVCMKVETAIPTLVQRCKSSIYNPPLSQLDTRRKKPKYRNGGRVAGGFVVTPDFDGVDENSQLPRRHG